MGSFLEEILKSGAGEQVLNVIKGQMGGDLGSILGKMGMPQQAEPEEVPEMQTQAPEEQQVAPEETAEEQALPGGIDLGSILGKAGGLGSLATAVINVIGLAKGALGGSRSN